MNALFALLRRTVLRRALSALNRWTYLFRLRLWLFLRCLFFVLEIFFIVVTALYFAIFNSGVEHLSSFYEFIIVVAVFFVFHCFIFVSEPEVIIILNILLSLGDSLLSLLTDSYRFLILLFVMQRRQPWFILIVVVILCKLLLFFLVLNLTLSLWAAASCSILFCHHYSELMYDLEKLKTVIGVSSCDIEPTDM